MIEKQIYYAMVRKSEDTGYEFPDDLTFQLDPLSAQIMGETRDKEFSSLPLHWPIVRLGRFEIKEVPYPKAE